MRTWNQRLTRTLRSGGDVRSHRSVIHRTLSVLFHTATAVATCRAVKHESVVREGAKRPSRLPNYCPPPTDASFGIAKRASSTGTFVFISVTWMFWITSGVEVVTLNGIFTPLTSR